MILITQISSLLWGELVCGSSLELIYFQKIWILTMPTLLRGTSRNVSKAGGVEQYQRLRKNSPGLSVKIYFIIN